MSYKEDLIEAVNTKVSAKVEQYKDFMEQYVVEQLVGSTTQTAVVGISTLDEEDINVEHFLAWLSKEDIEHSVVANVLTITLN